MKPSRYNKPHADNVLLRRKAVKDNPGNENSILSLRDRVERTEQSLGLKQS